uniref:LIM domain only protein 3 n=1 Tax=Bursaphelenchus xylophilus TaxID=6326 RepID=A0A1I7RX16_BURXY
MECAVCHQIIREQFALSAIGRFFHDDCLRCSCCNGVLAEISRIFYHRDRLVLCLNDYMRLYGSWGFCERCEGPIAPTEWIIKVDSHRFHVDCFDCFECKTRFCVGDQCFVKGHRILCQDDYSRLYLEK